MKVKKADKIATIIFYTIATFVTAFLSFFIIYILIKGWEALNLNFIFGESNGTKEGGGIGIQLFNSFYMLFISLLITVPIGIGGGIYLSEYAGNGKIVNFIRLCLETMASLPSIVVGLFGLLVFVTLAGWKYSILAGALSVSILNLPSMTRISENAIKEASKKVREASLGLGATRWQTIKKVTIPIAIPGILTGIILSAGRILGEAAAFLYTAGMIAPIVKFDRLNLFSMTAQGKLSAYNLFRPAETLAVHIWKLNSEGIVPDAAKIVNGSSAILILIVLIFNFGARIIGNGFYKHYTGK